MAEVAPQVHMALQVQARPVTDPLEHILHLVLTLRAWPTKLILALTVIVVCNSLD